MDIKDSYLHGTVGVVKSISVSADKLKYTLADIAGTVREVTLPVATLTANGLLSKEDKTKLDNMIATKVANDLILKINSGTTEGTSLYTYNGSAAKTLDIKLGSNVTLTAGANSLTIAASDTKVTLTNTTTDASYRVLFSGNANDTTETTTARKSANLLFNPNTGKLTAGHLSIGGDIIFTGNNRDQYLYYCHNNAWAWRTGHQGTGTSETNYFVIQNQTSGTVTTSLKIDYNANSKATFIGTVVAPTFQGNLDGTYINALTGYTKATSASNIAATDTLNTALGKLEYKADTAYSWYRTITDDDTDDIINKWDEVVDFVNNLEVDLTDEFVTRKTDLTITGTKTFQTSTGNIKIEDASVKIDMKLNGSWARGFEIINTNNSKKVESRFGAYGHGDSDGDNILYYTFISHGSLGYSNATLKIYDNKATISDNEIYHKGNLKNLSDLNDDILSGKYLPLTGGTLNGGTNRKVLILDGNANSGGGPGIYINYKGVLKAGVGYNDLSLFGSFLLNWNSDTALLLGNDKKLWFCHGAEALSKTYEIYHTGNLTNLSQLNNDLGFVTGGPYLPLSGGTMTGPITLTSGSNASFDKTALSFVSQTGTEQVRIGTNSSDNLGIYSIGNIYLKPNSSFTANGPGVALSSTEFTYNNYKIWHEGNDGTDSGLDADLLDGKHASEFALNTSLANYVQIVHLKSTSDKLLSNRVNCVGQSNKGDLAALTENPTGYGSYISIAYPTAGSASQIYLDTSSRNLGIYYRTRQAGSNHTTYRDWRRVLDENNYYNYSPKLDGTGAFGTWGISITGNSATSDLASLVRSSGLGTTNVARHVWFSGDSPETARVYDDSFVYNPATKVLTVGAISGSASKLGSTTIVSSKAFSLVNTQWIDVKDASNNVYTFANLASGTYAIQITCGNLVASGIMSVYKNITDTALDEIPLHVYHDSSQPWRPYLRTSGNKLLISSNDATALPRKVTIKIALIL